MEFDRMSVEQIKASIRSKLENNFGCEVAEATNEQLYQALARTVRMVTEGKVTAITGEEVAIQPHSICVHGDNPSAVAFVGDIRRTLEKNGVAIRPLSALDLNG